MLFKLKNMFHNIKKKPKRSLKKSKYIKKHNEFREILIEKRKHFKSYEMTGIISIGQDFYIFPFK